MIARGGTGALLGAALLLASALSGCAAHAASCGVCKREVHKEVRAAVVLAGGRRVVTCCPRCALRYAAEIGDRSARIEVTDYPTGDSLDLAAAFVIEASDETPCLRHHGPATGSEGAPLHLCYDRCMPSLIAFRDEASARAFVTDHGGELHRPGAAPSAAAGRP